MQANPPVDRQAPAALTSAGMPAPARAGADGRRGIWKLWLIVVICALPFPLAAAIYFAPAWLDRVPAAAALVDWLTPDRRSNYGMLVEPQRPMPALATTAFDGRSVDLAALRGKWIMLGVSSDACDQACASRLYTMRQVRASTGKDQLRIQRVLLVTGDAAPAPQLLAAYEGTLVARVDAAQLAAWLPAAEAGTALADHLYLIDPLGNLMLRWPRAADPAQVRKDIGRLLWASQIG